MKFVVNVGIVFNVKDDFVSVIMFVRSFVVSAFVFVFVIMFGRSFVGSIIVFVRSCSFVGSVIVFVRSFVVVGVVVNCNDCWVFMVKNPWVVLVCIILLRSLTQSVLGCLRRRVNKKFVCNSINVKIMKFVFVDRPGVKIKISTVINIAVLRGFVVAVVCIIIR